MGLKETVSGSLATGHAEHHLTRVQNSVRTQAGLMRIFPRTRAYLARSLVVGLHAIRPLRRIAKRTMRGWTVSQSFHGGVIQFDAVEHAWAWTGATSYEKFDVSQQEVLLELSRRHSVFVDIGCNIGAMTLSVLLRNSSIRAIAVDPNRRCNRLLRGSLARNKLTARAQVIQAAVAVKDETVCFDETGSVTGHVVERGRQIEAISFERLIREASEGERGCLVKLDVEGYERRLLDNADWLPSIPHLTLVIELHPEGYNAVGDPLGVIAKLRSLGATLRDLRGGFVGEVDKNDFSIVVVDWS